MEQYKTMDSPNKRKEKLTFMKKARALVSRVSGFIWYITFLQLFSNVCFYFSHRRGNPVRRIRSIADQQLRTAPCRRTKVDSSRRRLVSAISNTPTGLAKMVIACPTLIRRYRVRRSPSTHQQHHHHYYRRPHFRTRLFVLCHSPPRKLAARLVTSTKMRTEANRANRSTRITSIIIRAGARLVA